MKTIIPILAHYLLLSCSPQPEESITAKLRITQCVNSKNGDGVLLLTTLFENKTGKDIYLIKGFPFDSPFHRDVSDNLPTDLAQELGTIPPFDFECISNVVTPINYLKKVIDPDPKKRELVDSVASINNLEIKKNYDNDKSKFKMQLLVLNKGEVIEVNNVLVSKDFDRILKYKYSVKRDRELDKRIADGENLIMPSKIGKYYFWDGEITLDSEKIEVLFKIL